MENIEQLKQDNAKLNERLNNAAKFFREQKAQIEALTKENEELKRTSKEEVIDTEKWNALVTEKENLNKQCNEYELKLQAAEEKAEMWQKNLRSVENTTNEEVKKVTIARDEWIEKYRKLEEQFKEQEKFESDVINTKVPELETKLNNAEAAYEELRKEHNALNETYNKLNNEYSDVYKKYNDLEQVRIKSEEQLNALNTLCIQAKEDNKELQEKIDKQQEKYNITLQELENAKANREEFRSKLVETEEQYDRLNKLYDTCEAEKISAQANCEQLQEKIKSIEANNINNKEWQDHLENVIKQIRNLADDVINPKPATPENKENIMKRTGDYNVSGQNIGV